MGDVDCTVHSSEAVSWTRGVVILIVILDHYLMTRTSLPYRLGSNAFVSFFFLASGFGIWGSLNVVWRDDLLIRSALLFVWKRLKRIYPLYWLYVILHVRCNLQSISISDFMALKFTNPDFEWFVPSLVQCYLVAPLLFVAVRRLGEGKFLLIIIGLCLLLNVVAESAGISPVRVWFFREVGMGHVFLFAIGLVLRSKLQSFRFLRVSVAFQVVMSGFFLCAVWIAYHDSGLPLLSARMANVAVLLSSVAVFSSLLGRSWLPDWHGVIKRCGLYSYSLYLFHGSYLTGLAMAGVISARADDLRGLFAIMLFFPPFALLSATLENVFSRKVNLARNWNWIKNSRVGRLRS